MLLINPYRFAAPRSSDADVNAYILAVEAADGQELEAGVITAVETFVLGCKSDGIWSAIKASCILAGARTLSGALVPLVGTAPTNFNFVSADYDRETGLKGDGSTKYLNSNRNNNAEPSSSRHIYTWASEASTSSAGIYIGMGLTGGATTVMARAANVRTDLRIQTGTISIGGAASTGGYGIARIDNSTTQVILASSVTDRSDARTSSPAIQNLGVFANAAATPTSYNNARMSFYSIGENLNLGTLNSRVSTLMTDLAAAI